MKKKILFVITLSIVIAACRKNETAPDSMLKTPIVGKWTIMTVTTVARDSATGQVRTGGTNVYDYGSYFFQFNADGTWSETFSPNEIPSLGIDGNYTLKSDTAFTLMYPDKAAADENCKIYSLSKSEFVFSHTRTTAFNGVTPGYIEYIFDLTK